MRLGGDSSAVLAGVTSTDPLTFDSVAGLVVVVALVACVSPARRARRLDPAPRAPVAERTAPCQLAEPAGGGRQCEGGETPTAGNAAGSGMNGFHPVGRCKNR